MKKYKVNIDRPSVSPGEVRDHMDFNKVLNQYKAVTKPFYKTGGFIASAAIVAVAGIAGLILTLLPNNNEQVVETKTTPVVTAPVTTDEETKALTPPIENVDIEYSTYQVSANKQSTIKHNKTTITIPAEAFLDAQGQPITKPVDIKYREFNDAGDIIVSGLPAVYDKDNNKFSYKNGNTLEIEAYSDGEKVELKPGKEIGIKIEVEEDAKDLDLYKLDKEKKGWSPKGTVKGVSETRSYTTGTRDNTTDDDQNISIDGESDMMQSMLNIDTKIEFVEQEIETLKQDKPKAPAKANDSAYGFNIDFLPEEFPELVDMEGVSFEIPIEDTSFSKEKYEIDWNSIELTKNEDGKSYSLTLGLDGVKETYIVYPVLEGRDYKKAFRKYESNLEMYESKLQAKYDELNILKQQKLDYVQKMKEYREQHNEQPVTRLNIIVEETRVYRTFSISSFGIYTSIQKEAYPTGLVFTPKFKTANGEEVSFKEDKYFLADITKNAMYAYLISEKLGLDPNSNNMLWGILTNGKLAVVRNQQLMEVGAGEEVELIIEVAEKDFKTVEEIKAFLGI